MKIASITLFCNERFRLTQWINYFSEYKEDIYLQVIVNNGRREDNSLLQSAFPSAIILFSETSNMTASYNLAINYILNNSDADSILQITNDLRLEKGGLTRLYNILYKEKQFGMISPILLKKDSDVVENYGAEIDFTNMIFRHICRNELYDEVHPDIVYRTGLPGGCFLTKREVYEKIGLQDEILNMYSDEVDTGIKCANSGYKLISTKLVKSWHQHVFPNGKTQRSRYASFYMSRNPIYLARKYYGYSVVFSAFWSRLKLAFIELMSCIHHLKGRESIICSLYSLKGCFIGLFMKM